MKKVRQGRLQTTRNINFSFGEALPQIISCNINIDKLIGQHQNTIRHPFLHLHAGGMFYHFIKAFDMLNVQGRNNMNTGSKNLFNIFISPGISVSWNIGMRKFVNKHNGGMTLEKSINIHFGNFYTSIKQAFPGYNLQPWQQGFSLLPVMGFYKADNNINTIVFKTSCLLQHLPRFSNASAIANIDFQLTSLRALNKT